MGRNQGFVGQAPRANIYVVGIVKATIQAAFYDIAIAVLVEQAAGHLALI